MFLQALPITHDRRWDFDKKDWINSSFPSFVLFSGDFLASQNPSCWKSFHCQARIFVGVKLEYMSQDASTLQSREKDFP